MGISYESDLLLAKQILRELIEKDPELLDREETQVFVDELGDSAVILGPVSYTHLIDNNLSEVYSVSYVSTLKC